MPVTAPALGLLGEEDDEGRGGEDGRQPDESGIGAMSVRACGPYKGRASNPRTVLEFAEKRRALSSPSH